MPDSGLHFAASEADASEILEMVSTADLIAAWRTDFGVDVAAAFAGIDVLRLCRHRESGLIYFDVPVAGGPDFYARLRRFRWYHPHHKEEHAAAARLIAPGARVLDIGAGDGRFATFIPNAFYTGIENDPHTIADAQSRGLNVTGGTLHDLARAGRRFDAVTAFQVLEHMPAPRTFLTDALACLADGGSLILGVPDGESYVADLPDFVLNAPPHHLTWWTEASLRALTVELGLTDVTVRRFPVERWERRLWWMARIARCLAPRRRARFGHGLRPVKIASWLAAGLFAPLPLIPASATGSTLLLSARKPAG